MSMSTITGLRLLGDRVAVRMATPEEKSKGGIVLPSASQDRPTRGIVVAVGPGIREHGAGQYTDPIPLTVQIGDLVLWPTAWTGDLIEIDGEDVRIMRESEIIAILSSKDTDD